MRTLEELTATVETLEVASEQAAQIAYLKARLAGVKSRYASLEIPLPADVADAITEVDQALAVAKANGGKLDAAEAVKA